MTYTSAANFNGSDAFTYTVTDRGDPDNCTPASVSCTAALTSLEQTVTITVNPLNDAPTINAIANQIMLSNVPLTVGMTGISEGPLNERDDQTLGVTASSSDTSVAEVSVSYAPDASTGTLTITPKPTSCGVTTITVTVTDSGPATPPNDNSTSVSFTVSTFHGHFHAAKEGARNLVQKGQVVPVKIDFGCPGSMPGLTPAIKLLKGDYTSDLESGMTPIEPTVSVSAADTTGFMRAADGKYIYNMYVPKTGDMTAGTELTIRVWPLATTAAPTFGPMMQIVIEIRK